MNLFSVNRILVKIRKLKWLWWSLILFAFLGYLVREAYSFIDTEFMVAEELPFYHVGPRPEDDTLRVAVIGDSWAEFHMTLKCDTLFEQYGKRLTTKPIKCMNRGKGGAKSKEVYHYMFRSQTQEVPWMHDVCTQPLLEKHGGHQRYMEETPSVLLYRKLSSDYQVAACQSHTTCSDGDS